MSYTSKKPAADPVYEDQVVWQCTSCKCWSRLEFVLDEEPECPMCKSKMTKETKNIRVG
jgi:uncharacterized paraquat-inducible protein A